MDTAFVFDPKGSYDVVRKIRRAGRMPSPGLRYVASVTGPYKLFHVVEFDALDRSDRLDRLDGRLDDRLDALPGAEGSVDPPTALAMDRGKAKVRRSSYREHTALVRIHVSVADPRDLLRAIEEAIGTDSEDARESDEDLNVEADVVVGDFDILACVVDDEEEGLAEKIMNLRRIEGIEHTVTLRVIDYVSTSPYAPEGHQVSAAG
jgi:hypothetical protein